MANLRVFGWGARVLGLVAMLAVASCGGGEGGTGSGGVGGHAGATGGGGHGGTAGHSSGGSTGGSGGKGGTAGGLGTGGIAGAAGSTAGSSGGGQSGSAGMDGGTDAGPDAASDAGHDAGPADAGNNGMACTANSECTSNFCVDGVCCEAACTGTCSACSNTKTGQADGLCRPVKAATDPDDECPASAQSSCGLDGVCDGAGACRKWPVGTTCAPESCTGSTDTPARTCDGMGTCRTVTNTSCNGYLCGATSCKTSCTSAGDCAIGNNCIGGHCQPPQAAGAACTVATDCLSSNCVDGVCCDTACTGSCMACSHAKTGQADGTCAPVSAGTDPDSECAADVASGCGQDGTCNGAGACRLWAAGTACGAASCTAGTQTSARTCDGLGVCQVATTMPCGNYMCGATACETSCTANTDCATGYRCSAGACVAQETNGTACAANGDCASGNCVDGVCCNTTCTGTCQSCAVPGSEGTCTAATAGTDPHSDCNTDPAAPCANDGTCDGAGACRKTAAGTACGAASCASAKITAAGTCDGAGTCSPGAQTSCNAYQCNAAGTACGSTCTTDANCTTFCSASACVASPVNLAGNGDAEYGNTIGWSSNGGISMAASGTGLAHSGTYSLEVSGRDQNYQGPSYPLPTGAGKYVITAWAMQQDDVSLDAGFQVALSCGPGGAQQMYPGVGFTTLAQGVWTKISGTVDTSADVHCQPDYITPGVVTSATLYLNQTASGSPVVNPNLFLDDVVIQVTDGHNLIGNPNFEAGDASGWQNNGGGSLAVSSTVAHGGTKSLALTGRTQTYHGQRWNLPIGAAKYNVSFNVLHTGANAHTLMIQPTYTCKGGSANYPGAIGYVASVPGNTWTALSGTVTFPPADAPAGCKLTQAGLYVQQGDACTGTGAECPNLYIDDASITLAQ